MLKTPQKIARHAILSPSHKYCGHDHTKNKTHTGNAWQVQDGHLDTP